jgi:hypothetical protein
MRKSPSKKRSIKRMKKRSVKRSVKRVVKQTRTKLKMSGDFHPIQYLTKEWVDRQFGCPVTDLVYEELRMRVLYLIAYFVITEGQFIKTKDVKDKAFTKSQFEELVKTIKLQSLSADEIVLLHAMIETFLEECIINMKREKGDSSVDVTHGLRWWNKFKDQNGITDELHDEIRKLTYNI